MQLNIVAKLERKIYNEQRVSIVKGGVIMGNMLKYKGYYGTVEYSDEDNCLFGKVAGIRSLILYEGQSIAELKKDFEASVDDYLEMCAESGKVPEKPFKGSLNIRIGSELHQRVDSRAREENTSINAVIKKAIDAYC